MRAVVQRVRRASVTVAGKVIGQIGPGLCAFVGAGQEDADKDLAYTADKIVNLRIFNDEAGKMNRSVQDVGGGVLIISQFTVYGDVRRGRRPSFDPAMPPEQAREAYRRLVTMVRERGAEVATGEFAANMQVMVDNDGPVTILIDSRKEF